MKGLYLAARNDRHFDFNIVYNDIDSKYKCDITCDMLNVDLKGYDYLIATPPCNFYSKLNYRRYTSEYSLNTKHLLPCILEKFALTGKPFIVENVRSDKLFRLEGVFDICDRYNINVYYLGRHTYFTNLFVNLYCKQEFDFKLDMSKSYSTNFKGHTVKLKKDVQGGTNVHNVIEIWLKYIEVEETKKFLERY